MTKSVIIQVNNLNNAHSKEYCYYIQDCVIDTLINTKDVTKIKFEREKTVLSISFDVKISAVSDYICALCKEYVQSLLENNDKLHVQMIEKEDISDHYMVYNIQAQQRLS